MPVGGRRSAWVLLAVNAMGGAETSLIKIARGLQTSGMDVTLVLYGKHTDIAPDIVSGLTRITLTARSTLSALFALRTLLRGQKPDVLISGLRHTNLAALLAAKSVPSSPKVILTEHTPVGMYPPGRAGRKQRIIWSLLRLLYPKADALVGVSQGIGKSLIPWMRKPQKLHVIYNPVVSEPPTHTAAPHPWLSEGQPPVVLGIGRLRAEKNFALLLRAFAHVVTVKDARLILLGDGVERAALESLARSLGVAEKVFFAGFALDIFPWLTRASVFVSPSRFEGFGNAIVEAMHARVPVIATDCPVGPREILDNGRFGRLIPLEDENALAGAISDILGSRPEVQPAYERAQQFSDARCIAAYKALIEELVP